MNPAAMGWIGNQRIMEAERHIQQPFAALCLGRKHEFATDVHPLPRAFEMQRDRAVLWREPQEPDRVLYVAHVVSTERSSLVTQAAPAAPIGHQQQPGRLQSAGSKDVSCGAHGGAVCRLGLHRETKTTGAGLASDAASLNVSAPSNRWISGAPAKVLKYLFPKSVGGLKRSSRSVRMSGCCDSSMNYR